MKVQLNSIKPSPNPIRKTWDKEKMTDLMWSLMEEGQVEPVGLTEDGLNNYTIVWGHRRVEAARKASWQEIEAVIVPKDEVDNLIQAGIENLAGEDMTADEKAEWAYRLTELGLSQMEIARRSTVPQNTLQKWLVYKREKDAGLIIPGDNHYAQDEGIHKIVNVSKTLGSDLKAKQAVLDKASNEKLNRDQVQFVAQAYRDAPTPEVKQAVLKQPIVTRDTAADILRRSINRVEFDTGIKIQKEHNEFDKEREERDRYHTFDFAVKEYLDSMRLFTEKLSLWQRLVKMGKFTPEAARFTIRKNDALIDTLQAFNEALEEVE